MNTTIQGLCIILGTIPDDPQDSNIGLYSNPSTHVSELRWIEQSLVVPGSPTWSPTAWAPGIIAEKGIGEVKRSCDLKLGGNLSDYSGCDALKTNAAAAVIAALSAYTDSEGNPVCIEGKRAEIWEFRGTAANSGSVSAGPVFSGVVGIPERDTIGYGIPIKSPSYLLTAPLGTVINNGGYESIQDIEAAVENGTLRANYPFADSAENGKIIPVTLGTFAFDGVTGVPAKLIRTAAAVVPVVVNGVTSAIRNLASGGTHAGYWTDFYLPGAATRYAYCYATAPDYGNIRDFPVTDVDNHIDYKIKIGSGGVWYVSTDYGATWATAAGGSTELLVFNRAGRAAAGVASLYLTAVDGTQNSNGRLISAVFFDASGAFGDAGVLVVEIADTNYFTKSDGDKEDLQANASTVSVTGDTWVQLQQKWQEYAADTWPGGGWL